MNLEEIFEHWDKDCIIDRTKLDQDAIDKAKLHNKYIRFLAKENMTLKTLREDFKVLTLDKEEFLTQGATPETNKKGWKLPSKGVLRVNKEVEKYLGADPDIIEMNLKIGLQEEKVEVLKSIVNSIAWRHLDVKNAIDFIKWTSGN